MNIGENVKKLRQERGLLQKQVAAAIGVHASNYNRIEKGERQFTVEMLVKVSKLFELPIGQIIDPNNVQQDTPDIYDKTLIERVRAIDELEDEDKKALFIVLEAMLEKKRSSRK